MWAQSNKIFWVGSYPQNIKTFIIQTQQLVRYYGN
jgi:hypothetical protein